MNEVHKLRCDLLNALSSDREDLVSKVADEIKAADYFLGEARRHLKTICSHEKWHWCDIYYAFECDVCGKQSETPR